ncbi:MAG: arginine deiminase family protein [Leptospiraceae bacterium]|nr:arginine deiminase family protein [Leptospiraceae bacterium]MCZ8346511.1 arginine deiminase family protein [Leptospiraceae bacterium]
MAREEQQVLIDLLQKENVEVLIAENNIGISQHYTRDIGFAIDNLFIISKMGSQYRKDEPEGIKKFTNHFSKAFKITNGSIEGGDVLLYKDKVIVGLGEATNLAGLNNLKRILNENQNKREIVPISFNQRGVINLDTKFNIIGENLAIFYPQCFEKNSLKWFENHFELIEANKTEASQILINTFSISPTKVIMKNGSDRLANLLSKKGINPILIKYDEITKQPGSLRCTTCPIERKPIYSV